MSFIELNNISKTYKIGDDNFYAARNVTFAIEQGEFTVIVGPSGAGKTTILNILGGMESPDEGTMFVAGKSVSGLNSKRLTTYRRSSVGYVYQHYNLVQNLTAFENVELAAEISPNPLDSEEILRRVGLEDRMDNFPSQMSGGEQQRVAIARALVKRPMIVLCDEPTGALDFSTGKEILSILREITKRLKTTVIIITHNMSITPIADRVIQMRSGTVSKQFINPNPVDVSLIEW
ncbi:MAG: ABC transporter ATP-binding protein [Eubacteriaceae bacterium]|jgi:putative ABC transport system ATP-binding protein|nr:ABC transporter ATP-binding protein [Eubacteriaceae bacterium]